MLKDMALALVVVFFSGVVVHLPRNTLLLAGLTGTLGWLANKLAGKCNLPAVFAALLGAALIGFLAEFLAKRSKVPSTVFVVSGILPLVPSSIAYNSMYNFIQGRYLEGIAKGIDTVLIAAHIAGGIAVASVTARYLREKHRK